MKVALIGATGFVGTALVNELEKRGHEITAIARHPEKVKAAENIHPVKADAYNADEVSEAVKGHDVVVSTFNSGWDNPNIYDDFLRGAQAIQEGVRKAGVKRFFLVGGAGSLFVAPGVQLVDSPQFPAEWKAGALAARDYLDILKNETELDWTFLSPAIEMHHGTAGIIKGTYRVGLDEPVFDADNRSIISVEDMSTAIVDELEQPKHIKQRFTVAY
ncbi:NAD(P)-dependent oxidoreductase [Mucilaginibacter limnophilus]|uniref:NAD(P)-dependent oxidoreductase n=1 Tax=Mucilaginibacter limnophilus TaxID=1932778 RepID=A0A3S2UK20_9SPHI|nr:NAD(P)-dependent oxidoreductase [Mucilaginibacter limnophilus]RVU00015.1 NAD(P)-dependent oxidoreductase [Mucilaginibacter limnophilus]